METIVKIKDSADGKKLLAYLKSLSFVKVIGDATNMINIAELKKKVSKAEKSKSFTLEEAVRKSESWKKGK